MVAPLIPRPVDQCYENCKGIPGRMQQLYSNLHLKVNDLISELNQKNSLQTPPINSYMEKSKVKQRTTRQRKIWKKFYEADLIYPIASKQVKMMSTVEKAIKTVSTWTVPPCSGSTWTKYSYVESPLVLGKTLAFWSELDQMLIHHTCWKNNCCEDFIRQLSDMCSAS